MLNIITHGGAAAGVLRLDATGPATYEVSILVAPAYYRRGLGKAALHLARRLVPHAELHADVRVQNDASHALFKSAGYVGTDGRYRLSPKKLLGTSATHV